MPARVRPAEPAWSYEALRRVGCSHVPRDGIARCAGRVVLRGEEARCRVEVAFVSLLERPCDAQVVATALGGRQCLVGDIADAAVAEVVGIEGVGAHDAPTPQLVERSDERLLVDVAGAGQHRRGELSSDGRRDAGQLAGRCGEAGESGRDHGLDLAAFRRRRARGVLGAALNGLDQEQRVALRLGEQARRLGGLERRAGHAFGKELGVGATEPAELDLGEPSRLSSPVTSSPTGCSASSSSRRAVAAMRTGASGSARRR